MIKIGAQLYTVRSACQTLEDFAQTLSRVADIGYTTVQVSGCCDFEPEWLKEQLDKNGLTCELTHVDLDRITNDTDRLVAEHNVFGCKHIGIGSMPGESRESGAKVMEFCDSVKAAAARMKELGSTLMYHNHAFEYENTDNGRNFMEILSDNLPAGEFGFTLDTYWVQYGGADVVSEIKRLSGRIPCVHFKDMEILADGTRRYCPVGSGIQEYEKYIPALEAAGTKYAFVEQDNCFGRDPFECLKSSYDYLKSIGLK